MLMAVPDIPIRHEIFHVECLSEADFSFLNCCQSSSTVFKNGGREEQSILPVLPHPGRIVYLCKWGTQRPFASITIILSEPHWCLALQGSFTAGKYQQTPDTCQHKASCPRSVYEQEDVEHGAASNAVSSSDRGPLIWALNSPLEGLPGTMHSAICGLGRGWIPVFWPQKMTGSSILRVPGLQSLDNLTTDPWDTLIEPLITRSHSVSPLQDSCVFQGSGWLVFF